MDSSLQASAGAMILFFFPYPVDKHCADNDCRKNNLYQSLYRVAVCPLTWSLCFLCLLWNKLHNLYEGAIVKLQIINITHHIYKYPHLLTYPCTNKTGVIAPAFVFFLKMVWQTQTPLGSALKMERPTNSLSVKGFVSFLPWFDRVTWETCMQDRNNT